MFSLKISLSIYFKVSLLLDIIQYYESTIVHLKAKKEKVRLKQILNYEYWNSQQDPITKTTGYVLFLNYEDSYEVSTLTELVENNRTFQCGTVTCTFTRTRENLLMSKIQNSL
jgi:hypothetical protein